MHKNNSQRQRMIIAGLAAALTSVGFIDATLLWYASKNMFPAATCQLDESLREYRPVGIQNHGLNVILIVFGGITLGLAVLNGIAVYRFFFNDTSSSPSLIEAVQNAGFLQSAPPRPGQFYNFRNESNGDSSPQTAIAGTTLAQLAPAGDTGWTPGQAPQTLQQLQQAITSPPFDWIGKCFRNPILIYGEQGCGKTSIAEGLAACRVLLFGDTVSVCDLHAHKNRWERLFPDTVGHNNDFPRYEQEVDEFLRRVEGSNDPAHTSIWDELTRLASNAKGDGMKDFLPAVLADCRKAMEHPILLAHDRTLKALGGAEGFSKARDRGLFEIRRTALQDSYGNPSPNPIAYISGLDRDEKGNPIEREIIVPPWFHGDYLLELGKSEGIVIPKRSRRSSKPNSSEPIRPSTELLHFPQQSPQPQPQPPEHPYPSRSSPEPPQTSEATPIPVAANIASNGHSDGTQGTQVVVDAQSLSAEALQESLKVSSESFSSLVKTYQSDASLILDDEISLSCDERNVAKNCPWFRDLPDSVKETLFVTLVWDRRRGVSKSDVIKRHLIKKCDYNTGKAIYESLFIQFQDSGYF